jgi:hypothetical protein
MNMSRFPSYVAVQHERDSTGIPDVGKPLCCSAATLEVPTQVEDLVAAGEPVGEATAAPLRQNTVVTASTTW